MTAPSNTNWRGWPVRKKRAFLAELRKKPTPRQTVGNRQIVDVLSFPEWLGVVTPGWQWQWPYLQYIQRALAGVTSGDTRRLMLFLPPRHGKSEMVTVRYPIWRMEREPGLQVIVGAYNLDFATEFSRKARKIAAGRLPLSKERAAAEDWETDNGGRYRAVGVGSGVTGRGGDLIIIDDPVKSHAEAASAAYRESVWNWYKEDLYTRLEPGAALILIMTRWHQNDLAGRILASEDAGEWQVIRLPARAQENDPLDRPVGAPLCPERFDAAALERIERVLGYAFLPLYQQDPQPPAGGFFKRAWFVQGIPGPHIRWWVRYWDRAASAGSGDYTAGVLLGMDAEQRFFIADVVRGQWDGDERDAIIKRVTERDMQRCEFYQVWEEGEGGSAGKDAGAAFVKMLAGFPAYVERIAGKGSKEVRAQPLQAQAMIQNVRLLPGSWQQVYLDELSAFPFGTNDDQVDATTGAFRRVRALYVQHTAKHKPESPAAGAIKPPIGSLRGKL